MCWTILVSIFGTLWQWCVPLHGSCKNWMEDLKLHPIIFQKTQDLPPSLPFTIRAGLKAGLWRCVFSLLLAVEDDKHTSFHLVAARCSSYASGCWSCFCCSLCHVLFVRFFLGGGFGNIQSCESWKCLWTWGEEPYILDHAFWRIPFKAKVFDDTSFSSGPVHALMSCWCKIRFSLRTCAGASF